MCFLCADRRVLIASSIKTVRHQYVVRLHAAWIVLLGLATCSTGLKSWAGSGVSTLFCRTCSDEDIAPYRVYNINQVSPYSTRRINFMSQLILWCDSLVESGVAHHSLFNEKTDNKKFWSNLCCLKAEEKDKDENHFKPLAPRWRHPKVQVWARWSSSWCFGGCRCVTGPGP